MEVLATVGDYLRRLRIERGLSAAQVAGTLGVGEASIYRIEGGRGDTRAGLLMRYGALVGASGDDLMALYSGKGVQCGCEAGV